MSDITEFSEYMFLQNKHDRKIQLNLEGIENNKDLFLFLIDLFCKGLVLCYGSENKVDFDSLDIDKFNYLKSKLANAGIHVNLSIQPIYHNSVTFINKAEIEAQDLDLPLEQYIFKVFKNTNCFCITFSLSRVL